MEGGATEPEKNKKIKEVELKKMPRLFKSITLGPTSAGLVAGNAGPGVDKFFTPQAEQGPAIIRDVAHSSCFSSITYEPIEGILILTFANPQRGAWRYSGIQPFEAAGLITASSQVEYFNRYIRDGGFQYQRIG